MIQFKQWIQENAESVEVIQTDPENLSPDFKDEITFRINDNVLRVVKNELAPTDWSVAATFVEEASRRQGIASLLIDKMLSTIKGSIGAQCSSDGSVRLFWKKGFRIEGTLEDALEKRKEWSSVNLIRETL